MIHKEPGTKTVSLSEISERAVEAIEHGWRGTTGFSRIRADAHFRRI